ncbi:MAG: A24 family peptidase [Isosphaeraceae bacterium]|nr:A24 family peptidase [Isosphaeraceae bacterium]
MTLASHEVTHGVIWFVSIVLVEAAVIDGLKLRVPNWLTYHLALGGLGFAAWTGGSALLLWALAGLATGLLLLLPLYAIGGMGAGDVKLLAGVGAWVGPVLILWAFVVSTVVGAVMALAMVAWSGQYIHHWVQLQAISHEILTIRDPAKLSAIAAERKPRMRLLPYGIPIAVGTIGYFAWMGLLV